MQTKIFATSLALIASTLHSTYANDSPDHYSYWVDRYPSEKSPNNQIDLLNQPALKKTLRNLLPQQELRSLSKYTIETPAEKLKIIWLQTDAAHITAQQKPQPLS
ncbi:hypothetical protein [Aquabacterium sp.]|uniref:hypothetical protein n=1 Tax=Aquabacterium sp. TaxID=1872578 RepID=UPI0035B17D10